MNGQMQQRWRQLRRVAINGENSPDIRVFHACVGHSMQCVYAHVGRLCTRAIRSCVQTACRLPYSCKPSQAKRGISHTHESPLLLRRDDQHLAVAKLLGLQTAMQLHVQVPHSLPVHVDGVRARSEGSPEAGPLHGPIELSVTRKLGCNG